MDALNPGGLFYLTINFDGLSVFEPPIDPDLDERILNLYHRSMDERVLEGVPSGDSRTGRHLFHHLRSAGVTLLEAGSSDWVVFPGRDGFQPDEAFFLHFIINTIDLELRDHPDLKSEPFSDWIKARHQQVRRGELVYIAHQIDFVGVKLHNDFNLPKSQLPQFD
jgi:hypothetical protein